MAKPGMQPVNGRKPHKRKISGRALSHAISGPEQPYPVYQFSRRNFVERPGHNPFSDLGTDDDMTSWEGWAPGSWQGWA